MTKKPHAMNDTMAMAYVRCLLGTDNNDKALELLQKEIDKKRHCLVCNKETSYQRYCMEHSE